MGLWNFSTTQLLCIKDQKKVLKFEKCEYIEYLRKLGLIVSKNLLLQAHIKNKQNWTTAENFDICFSTKFECYCQKCTSGCDTGYCLH